MTLLCCTDRLVYVADTGNHRIVAFDTQGRLKQTMGDGVDLTNNSPVLSTPIGLALSHNSKTLYVVDSGYHVVKLFDAKTGAYQRTIGHGYGKGPGHLNTPSCLSVSQFGDVYVADTGNCRIQVFTCEGYPLFDIGDGVGSNIGQFQGVMGVAVSNSSNVLFVSDYRLSRIQVCHADL